MGITLPFRRHFQKINYDNGQPGTFFAKEVKLALRWLLNVRDAEEHGWAWVQFIRPNEQNTAEVIKTLIGHIDLLSDDDILLMQASIEKWLIHPGQHAKITVDYSWVLIALLHVYQCEQLKDLFDQNELWDSIEECTNWLLYAQQENGGWADETEGLANTTRTSLALMALQEVHRLQCLTELSQQTMLSAIKEPIKKATAWLLASQNNDGGWGNIREREIDFKYQREVSLSYADLRFQCASNPACTGYALTALSYDTEQKHIAVLNRAAEYLIRAQLESGNWSVFMEVGVRDSTKFTFRHFGTTWALIGLIKNHLADFTDECVMKGIRYLLTLQDTNFGGWKCSEEADNYTWATCNALDAIHLIESQIESVKSENFMKLVYDWWELKKNEANFSFYFHGLIFAFNGAMGALFCVVFSIMMLLLVFMLHTLLGMMATENEILNGGIVVTISILMGLPWIVWVQNVFHKEMDNWINSIGWVYGIITGFVLVFYQYLF